MAQGRTAALRLLQAISANSCACPAHSHAGTSWKMLPAKAPTPHFPIRSPHTAGGADKEYAFEMVCSTLRFGEGVTREVGMDVSNLGIKKLCVVTDKNLVKLSPVRTALDSLHASGVNYELYEDVSIEPTNLSFEDAIAFARKGDFDGFLAVGGGSVMDTAKAANLFSCYPDRELLDFVAKPLGKGMTMSKTLNPLICVPTTSGTSSETTAVAVMDHKDLNAKIGIRDRTLKPFLGLVDPLHVKDMPRNVAIYSGFDMLCHSLESYTTLPYNERTPRPTNPIDRPTYQGRNPISDIWSIYALRVAAKYFKRSIADPEDLEARSAMHLACSCCGMGFGNSGVHLCHGMSYPIAGMVKTFIPESGYNPNKALVPHGLSVIVTAPAVFQFTAPLCPERHLEAAQILGADVTNAKLGDAGRILVDAVRGYMDHMGIVNGISALGYSSEDIPALVKGTLPQPAVRLSPAAVTKELLSKLFENTLTVY